MIRLANVYFPERTLLLAVSEALTTLAALIGALYIRFGIDADFELHYNEGFLKVAIGTGVFMVCLYYYDLYDSGALNSPREVWTRLVQVIGTGCVLLSMLYYLFPAICLGRGVLVLGVSLVGFALFALRKLFFVLNRSSLLVQKALLVGTGPIASALAHEIQFRPELGLRVLGYVADESEPSPEGVQWVGSIAQLSQMVERDGVHRVILTAAERRGAVPRDIVAQLKEHGIRIEDGPQVFEAITGKLNIDSLYPGMLAASNLRLPRALLICERGFNILFALIGLTFCGPLILVIAIAIKFDSSGSVLYRQSRVGMKGRIFEILKFRSMRSDAESLSGPVWAQKNDPRITRVGRILRNLRFDEIPQLINILKGDMNLVGPRPERPFFVERLRGEIPFYDVRHFVRPGVTGWAQVNTPYGATVEQNRQKLQYDLFYLKNLSMSFGLLIVFLTVKVALLGRGAQ